MVSHSPAPVLISGGQPWRRGVAALCRRSAAHARSLAKRGRVNPEKEAASGSSGGFCLDPSGQSFGDWDDDDEEGTEAWQPRPGEV